MFRIYTYLKLNVWGKICKLLTNFIMDMNERNNYGWQWCRPTYLYECWRPFFSCSRPRTTSISARFTERRRKSSAVNESVSDTQAVLVLSAAAAVAAVKSCFTSTDHQRQLQQPHVLRRPTNGRSYCSAACTSDRCTSTTSTRWQVNALWKLAIITSIR